MISHDGGLSFGVVLEKGQEGPRIANVPLLFVIEYVYATFESVSKKIILILLDRPK